MENTITSISKHFVLHQLADGVFTAIAKEGGAGICNVGLIDLGGQILVYDTFLTPQAALDLRKNAIELFGRMPQIVVNSHYHNDHIWGNQAFTPEAYIISSTRTRQLIAVSGKEELEWYSANAAEQYQEYCTQYANTPEEAERTALNLWLGYYAGLVEALPNLVVSLPTITFSNRLELYGSKLTAELITFEDGHTGSDTVLYLPQDGIIFMSDLLFVGCHPYLAEGNPFKLLKALKKLSQLDATVFVPGHGPVGTRQDLKVLSDYIKYCLDTAQKINDEGGVRAESLTQLKIDERFNHWQFPQFFYSNIRFLCERLSGESMNIPND